MDSKFLAQYLRDRDVLQQRLDLLKDLLSTMSLNGPTLAEGTAAATVKTTNLLHYLVNGTILQKAATDNIAIPAGTVVPISSKCWFLVTINAAGTFKVTQGSIVAAAAAGVFPAVPADEAVVGYFEIVTDGATTYTPGTTDNGAAGITDLYTDLIGARWQGTAIADIGAMVAIPN